MPLAVLTSARCLTEELGNFTRWNLFFLLETESLSSARTHGKLLHIVRVLHQLSPKHLWESHGSLAHFLRKSKAGG